MRTIRFELSDEANKKLMQIKGKTLKQAYAAELFERAINAEHKKQAKR